VDIRTHRIPLGSGDPAVEIRNPAGSVRVQAQEGATEYVVEVEALDSTAEQHLDQVEVGLGPGGRLRVAVPERRLLRTGSFAVRVTAPSGAPARVAATSADTELAGDLGKVELTSASGDCVVDTCAALQLRSASGDARVGSVTGRAVVGTASGDLRVESVGAGLEARTASGDIEILAAAGDVSIATASGDVDIHRVAGGSVAVKSMSGDVSIGVVPGLKVWLDLSSISGRMESHLDEDGDSDGPAALTLSVRTVSGDQHILRAAGTAPAV
jgi:Putative adhesin